MQRHETINIWEIFNVKQDANNVGIRTKITPTHSSTEAELISADTGTRNLTWTNNKADELLIPTQKRESTLIIDTKPSTKYHDKIIIPN